MWRLLILNYFFYILLVITNSYKLLPTSTRLEINPLRSTLTRETLEYKIQLSNKIFHFTEIIDDEIFESQIKLCSTGEIIFLKSTELLNDFHDVKGSWICSQNQLQMLIERTLLGSYSEYTVKSLYFTTREEVSKKLLSLGGDIYDNTDMEDAECLSNKFALKSNADTIGQFMIATETITSQGGRS